MVEVRNLVENIMGQAYLMSLATMDENGPWAADVIYTFDKELNLYWLSDKNARHSAAIIKSQKAAATITVSDRSGSPNIGLQIEGEAMMVEGDILDMAIKLNLKKGKAPPAKEGEILDETERKYGRRESWFKLKPKRIELLYQVLFGTEKKILEL
jgi:uncharacterized protein YhbP (UPF0306 family)